MPDQNSPYGVGKEPDSQRPVQMQVQSAGNQNVPSPAPDADAREAQREALELEKDIRSGEKWLIAIGVASVLVNIAIAAIYYGQLGEMRRATEAATKSANAADATLKEIRAGGTDTHDLAVAAKAQAAAAQAQSEQAERQVKGIQAMATETGRQADIARQALRFNKESADEDRRPWISIADIYSDNAIETAERFKVGAVRIAIHNSGKTPAIKVIFDCCMYTNRLWSDPVPNYDQITKSNEDFAERRRRENLEQGLKAFPNLKDKLLAFDKESRDREAAEREKSARRNGVVAPEAIQIIQVAGFESPRTTKIQRGIIELTEPMTNYILGKITYQGTHANDKTYTTKFCLMHTVGTAITFCPENNWMD